MNDFLDSLSRIAHWPLRFAISSVFLYHGLTKFPNLEGVAAGMNAPVVMIALLASVEVAGALLILVGGIGRDWMTRLGGLLIVPVMVGAILLVHLPQGWNSVNMGSGNMGRGMEFQFCLLMVALHFLLKGNRPIAGASTRELKRTKPTVHSSERPPKRADEEASPTTTPQTATTS